MKPTYKNRFEVFLQSCSLSLALLPIVALLSNLIASSLTSTGDVASLADIVLWLFFLVPSLVVVIRRRTDLISKLPWCSRERFYSMALMAAYLAIYVLHLSKYPIFPVNDSMDPAQVHAYRIKRISELGWTAVLSDNYPQAFHFAAWFFMTHTGIELLNSMRYVAVIIDLFTMLLVFSLATRIGDWRVGLASQLAYGFIFSPGIAHFFWLGTYANMFGNFYAIMIVYALYQSLQVTRKNYAQFLVLLMLGPLSVFAHLSSTILIVLLWALTPIIFWRFKIYWKRYAVQLLLISAILPLGTMIMPHVFENLSSIVTFTLTHPTPAPLSIYLFLFDLNRFVGPLAAVALFASAFYMFIHKRKNLQGMVSLLFGLWVFSGFVLNIGGDYPERFALYSTLPGCFVFGISLAKLSLPFGLRSFQERKIHLRKVGTASLLLILVFFSPSLVMLGDSLTNVNYASQKQKAIYESMQWIGKNTDTNAKILSVGIPEYRYVPYIADRTFLRNVDSDITVNTALNFLRDTKPSLIVARAGSQTAMDLEASKAFQWIFANQYVIIIRASD